jgi:hypothetical protein
MIEIKFASVSYTQFDRKGVRSAMGKAARIVAAQLRKLLNTRGGSGRVYRRGGRAHTASASGSPPARFTGNLVRSVKGRASRRGYAFVVSAIAPHAHLLEMGTERMTSRPAFAPIFGKQAGAIEDLLRTAIDKGITVTAGSPGQSPKGVEIN